MSEKRRVHLFFSEVDGGRARAKIKNAWIYWRSPQGNLVLRANDQGHVLRHTGGDPSRPENYRELFSATENDSVEVAYNVEPAQLDEPSIGARLTGHTVEISLDKTLAGLGPIFVPPGGQQVDVKVLPLCEIRLPKYHRFLRAIAVVMFGGHAADAHAVNMDTFLRDHYGRPGQSVREFRGEEERGFREEARRTVPASGKDAINIIQDIGAAARAVSGDAYERVVGLALHGNTDRIGRLVEGNFLTEAQLISLTVLQGDAGPARRRLQAAEERLERARAQGELGEIRAAEEEVSSRRAIIVDFDPHALAMLEAFEEAAEALAEAGVSTVELHACNAGQGPAGVGTLGFLRRLERFLSKRGGPQVSVKAHPQPIFTRQVKRQVTVWLGAEGDEGKPGSQTSRTSLPLP